MCICVHVQTECGWMHKHTHIYEGSPAKWLYWHLLYSSWATYQVLVSSGVYSTRGIGWPLYQIKPWFTDGSSIHKHTHSLSCNLLFVVEGNIREILTPLAINWISKTLCWQYVICHKNVIWLWAAKKRIATRLLDDLSRVQHHSWESGWRIDPNREYASETKEL